MSEIKSRRAVALWCAMFLLSGVGVAAWGAAMTVGYGVNSPAGVLGIAFVMLGTWNALRALGLRRYVWYGDLD